MAIIYHITTAAAWKAAKASGSYEAASLATEGFIHCCELKQMRGVLKSPSLNEAFPHVYGPIPATAVVEEMDL
jgi:uncharacterized protein (DUF952 family)